MQRHDYSRDWFGVIAPRDHHADWLLAYTDEVADAAREGDWARLLAVLDRAPMLLGSSVNGFRIGETSCITPMHQAAWHGADPSVVKELLRRGAWTVIPDAEGRLPVDMARERGHEHLLDVMTPTFRNHFRSSPEYTAALTAHLAALVEEVAGPLLSAGSRFRHLDFRQFEEDAGVTKVWFPVGEMYGGFNIDLYKGRLHVESWSRIADGAAEYHVVTPKGYVLVDQGFL